MWLGYPIHEELKKHQGTPILKDSRTNTKFHNAHTPLDEVIKLCTLQQAFPQIPQKFFSKQAIGCGIGTPPPIHTNPRPKESQQRYQTLQRLPYHLPVRAQFQEY